jgi:hypothetical protein
VKTYKDNPLHSVLNNGNREQNGDLYRSILSEYFSDITFILFECHINIMNSFFFGHNFRIKSVKPHTGRHCARIHVVLIVHSICGL